MTFRNFIKKSKCFFILNIILMIITAIFMSLNSYITIPLISALEQRNNNEFWKFIAVNVALGIVAYSCKSLSEYLQQKQIQEYLIKLRIKLFKNSYYSKKDINTSTLQNDVINNFHQLGQNYLLPFFTIISGIISIVTMFFTVSSINLWLSFFVLISAALTVLASRIFSKQLALINKKESESKGLLIKVIANWMPSLNLVRKYKKENVLYRNVLQQSKTLEDTKISKAKITENSDFLIDNVANLIEVGLLVIVGFLIFQKSLSLGVYAAIGSFLYSILGSMKNIGYSYTAIRGSEYINSQINKKLQIPKIKESQNLEDFTFLTATNLKIHFKNGEIITFPNFNLKKGEKVLLSGPSGVGKSTLLKIILGLRENVSGSIQFFSSKGKISNPELEAIGYIEQNPILFPGSIKDNITMFNNTITDKQVENKIQKMDFLSDIKSLSQGLDTQISSIDKSWLSGGQKQKIVLIRNSLSTFPIYLVDEATSAIDESSRYRIIKEFLKTDSTVLWIEHNLNKQIEDLFDRQIRL